MVDVLSGIRILDFSIWLLGPASTECLGDFGAEVIKVEPPTGEQGRLVNPRLPAFKGLSSGFMARNRNKKSICVDLRRPESKAIIRKLVETSDIAIQNFRPGVATRLGLTYEDLAQINPRLIYVVGTGYGATGPYQHKGGEDWVGQALSGLMAVTGDPNAPPTGLAVPIIDYLGAMHLTIGMLLALRARDLTGRGQQVDVSLLDTGIAGSRELHVVYLNTGYVRRKAMNALRRPYKAKDGWFLLDSVFVRGGNPLPLVCEAMGIADLSQNPRFRSTDGMAAEELVDILSRAFAEWPRDEIIRRMDEKDIICVEVNEVDEVWEDPQVQHNRMMEEIEHPELGTMKVVSTPIKLSETPGRAHLPPPILGEHTDVVLADLGFSGEEIAAFKASGAVAHRPLQNQPGSGVLTDRRGAG